MTGEELKAWKADFVKHVLGDSRLINYDDVIFYLHCSAIGFRFGNATGLIFADNGMNGPDDYYPLARLSCRYDDQCKYNPTVEPTLAAMAAAVKKSWADFTQGL